jgi:hypothetical protein
MVFIQFIPFIVILLLANLAERSREPFRILTYLLLSLINLALMFLGVLSLLVEPMLAGLPENPVATMPIQPQWAQLGFWLILTGLLGFVPFLRPVRRGLARVLPITTDSMVNIAALVFAIYLLGTTPAQLALLGNLENLGEFENLLGTSELWQQGAAFILMGLIGVGLWIRRPADAVADRLGLAWPSLRQWAAVLAITVGFVLLDTILAFVWLQFDPGGFERIAGITEAMFGGLMSPLGALTIGLAAGLGEEIVFRGALQPRFGLWLTTFLFAVSHLQYGLSPAFVQVFLLGLVLGWVRIRGNLTMSIAIHTLYNTTLVALALLGASAT